LGTLEFSDRQRIMTAYSLLSFFYFKNNIIQFNGKHFSPSTNNQKNICISNKKIIAGLIVVVVM